MRPHVLLLAAMLAGCATWSNAPITVTRDPATVLVTPQSGLDRETTLIDVIDFHTPADSQDKGYAALREKAALLGADAVVGTEYEHGEDDGLSHLSGMAVRYSSPDSRPFRVLGEIDIATPEDADDKGHKQFVEKAWLMGADEIRDIRLEHGEEGGMSHLRGIAVVHDQ